MSVPNPDPPARKHPDPDSVAGDRVNAADLQDAFRQMLSNLPDADAGGAVPAEPANFFGEGHEEKRFVASGHVPLAPEPYRPVNRLANVPVIAVELASPGADGYTQRERPQPGSQGDIGRQILDELETHSIPSVAQLRIAVRHRTVTIVGEVPGEYERGLVLHVASRVEGVDEILDRMRVVGGPGLASGPMVPGLRRQSARRNPRPAYSRPAFALPFSARTIGIVAGIAVMIWAGYSYATRDGARPMVYPVTGKVFFDGQPAIGSTVTLYPVDPSVSVRPKGYVDADGSYHLTTYLPADGAPRGEYKLTVEWHKPVRSRDGEFVPGPNLLPEALARPATSTVVVSVGWGWNTLDPLNLSE